MLSLLSAGSLAAQSHDHCSETEERFVEELVNSNAFSEQNLMKEAIVSESLDDFSACVVSTPFVTDGISYTLFKSRDSEINYIVVNNGLDGSDKTYGPFIRKELRYIKENNE